MKFNISFPETGQQKLIEIDDDMKVRNFYDRRMGQEIEGEVLGEEFKGYIFRIAGGNDKQGFPMKQGVLENRRVRLLLADGHSCYRPRRKGERKRKSIRGCIVSYDIAVLHLVIVQKGEQELPGLTDDPRPRRLGPKRANHIRKLFALSKEDDVRKYVVRRKIEREGKPAKSKAPKIQRLITEERLRRKTKEKKDKKEAWERAKTAKKNYLRLVNQVMYRKNHPDKASINDEVKQATA